MIPLYEHSPPTYHPTLLQWKLLLVWHFCFDILVKNTPKLAISIIKGALTIIIIIMIIKYLSRIISSAFNAGPATDWYLFMCAQALCISERGINLLIFIHSKLLAKLPLEKEIKSSLGQTLVRKDELTKTKEFFLFLYRKGSKCPLI